MAWAVIDEEGRVLHIRNEPPPKDSVEGTRLSFWDHVLGSGASGAGFILSWGSAQGSAIFQPLGNENTGYNIRVLGTKVKDVEKVTKELRKALGVRDLTPFFLKLPDLPGRVQRFKFLVKYVWSGVKDQKPSHRKLPALLERFQSFLRREWELYFGVIEDVE